MSERCTREHAYAVTGERGALIGRVVATAEQALAQWAESGDDARKINAAHLGGTTCRVEEVRLAALAARPAVHGPYDSSAQAFADAAPLNAAIHAVDPGPGPMTDAIRARRLQTRADYLIHALMGAGVELGEYDTRIAVWLADWETETLQVLVGWIERAHAAARTGTEAKP